MQRIIQINIAGRLIAIEEDAYSMLKDYIESLERHFMHEEGKDEIIQDIEGRIAELFSIRLEAGAHSVDRQDVKKVIDTLGPAYDLGAEHTGARSPYLPVPYGRRQREYSTRRLFRNPNDKMLGGVCSGLANYFDIDPVIMRLVFVMLFLAGLIGLLVYIIAWIVIPYPRTAEEIAYMTDGKPMNFHTIKKNVGEELRDLKHRGEAMSRELRDFFSRKK